MVTGVLEVISYCFLSTSSGKQKNTHSTSQPQFRSGSTPATIETDQILLALQQMASNSKSTNFNQNIKRILKLLKSLTTTIPTVHGKSEKFELFEDLLHTFLKTHNPLSEEDKLNYSHFLLRCHAFQTFNKPPAPTERNW